MSNRQGKTVLLKPKSRAERAIRARYSTAAVLWHGTRNPETQRAIGRILFNGQSWAKKMERLRAEVLEPIISEFHSCGNLRRLGLKKATCTCPPGQGHNA